MSKTYLESLLGQTEQVLLVVRQHWSTLVQGILLEVVIGVVILLGLAALTAVVGPFAWLGLMLLGLPLGKGGYDFAIWWNRQYVVTSRRVIQLSGVVDKNVTDSSLEKVNDVKMEQSFLGRVLDYGDVEILTASELGVNRFEKIAAPIRFKTAMLNAKEQLSQDDDTAGGARGGKEDIPAMIAKLDALRRQGAITEEEFAREKASLLARL